MPKDLFGVARFCGILEKELSDTSSETAGNNRLTEARLTIKTTRGPYESATETSRRTAKRPPGPRHVLGIKFVQRFRAAPLQLLMELHEDYGDVVYSRMGPYRA